MKNILIILILFLANKGYSQAVANELTTEQFNNIKIEGILKTTLEATQGDIIQMESVFGSSEFTEGPDGIGDGWRIFTFSNGLTIGFTDIYSQQYDASIEGFDTNSITIKEITVNVGDNISLLGSDIIFNPRTDGAESIIFTHSFYDCCPIIIEFNHRNIITKIAYYVWS